MGGPRLRAANKARAHKRRVEMNEMRARLVKQAAKGVETKLAEVFR